MLQNKSADMNISTTTEIKEREYHPIFLESLRLDTILKFDLYLLTSGKYILFKGNNLPFTESDRRAVPEGRIRNLYVSRNNLLEYQRYTESNISDIINDTSIREETKAAILYGSASLLVKDVLARPTIKENIERSKAMVENTVSFFLKVPTAFHNMLSMMSLIYKTFTHSINVCTFSIGLARFIGIDSQTELDHVGIGALLHDVGKTKIPESVLNKPGPLNNEEMAGIKMHPKWGCDLLRQTDIISQVAYRPIMEHHEREDGTGYPHGLSSDNIHLYSKIVAIADVFDAMTREHTYCKAVSSFTALKYMHDGQKHFDRTLLEHFTKLIGLAKIAEVYKLVSRK